jgi:hypothetical protein
MTYTTKSTKKHRYSSGYQRDTPENKPRYDLIPHEMLKRLAELYARGAEKYGDNNWKLANSEEEYTRFRASAFRHFIQWISGEEDEDHASAILWNVIAYEWHTKHKGNKVLFSTTDEKFRERLEE